MELENSYFDHSKKYDQDYEEEYDLFLFLNEVRWLVFVLSLLARSDWVVE